MSKRRIGGKLYSRGGENLGFGCLSWVKLKENKEKGRRGESHVKIKFLRERGELQFTSWTKKNTLKKQRRWLGKKQRSGKKGKKHYGPWSGQKNGERAR